MNWTSQPFDAHQTMQRRSFEIYHYRDANLKTVQLHHHDFYELFFFHSGSVTYRVEGKVYCPQPGDLLLMGPMELHQLTIEQQIPIYERTVLWMDASYLRDLCAGETEILHCFDRSVPGHSNLLHLSSSQRLLVSNLLEQLLYESHNLSIASNMLSTGLLLQLLAQVSRMAKSCKEPTGISPADPLIAEVLDYLSQQYHTPISLSSLSAQFYVSKFHLSHAFCRTVGVSIYRYVLLKRLSHAKQLLRSGIPAGSVCRSVGFGDYTNFYRAFKSEFGMSPTKYATCSSDFPPIPEDLKATILA